VLDIGCGDGQGAVFLASRGASAVLGLDLDADKPGNGVRTPSALVTVRTVAPGEILREGGLRAIVANANFDVVFLHATPELLTPGFLGELRRLLLRGGHVVVAGRSKEAFADKADAVGYFELLDSVTQAGFGPVTMFGQNPFLGAAVVPFGASEPPLVFDDTLAPSEPPEEYVALCGQPPARVLPYQVVKLPRQALELLTPPVAASPAPLAKEPPPVKVVERVEVKVADPQVVAERDQLKSRVAELQTENEKRLQQEQELQAALRAGEGQRREMEERLRQRSHGEAESAQAAVLHERQMRELRVSLEERDAFVSELEDQVRELPKLREQLAAAQKLAEESQRSERQGRQRLAETEGLLLRARNEQQVQALQGQLAVDLEARQRELEAVRRELLMQRVEQEQVEQTLAEKRAAIEHATQGLAQAKAGVEKEHIPRAQHERAVAERDTALTEARQELLVAQERLQHLHAELEQRTRDLTAAQAELERLRREGMPRARIERTAVLATPALGTSARGDNDGVPLLVGDMPTAPVAVGTAGGEGQPTLQQEISQLQQRIAELLAENDRLKDKITEAERETWKHMKARSEAEQAAAEVREDTVRKLRDARKLASVELTRAMEDATKKAVQLREELARTEAERKEALAQIKELRTARDTATEQLGAAKQELESLRWSAEMPAQEPSAAHAHGGATGHAEANEERQRVMASFAEERLARQTAQQAADEARLRVAELRSTVVGLEQALTEARTRSEREQQRIEALEEELRQAGGPRGPEGATGEFLRLQQELQQQGRLLSERTAEREALARLLAEVEREAAARAERARTMRVRLSERERETEALRAELYDRERKIAALEQQTPPSEEVARLEADLQATRQRISDILEETARSEHHGDDAVATALRERARAIRMNESLEQATRERDEARGRASSLEQRLQDALAESERLRLEALRHGHESGPNAVPPAGEVGQGVSKPGPGNPSGRP
jgi:SAM-dependent methyltransferase